MRDYLKKEVQEISYYLQKVTCNRCGKMYEVQNDFIKDEINFSKYIGYLGLEANLMDCIVSLMFVKIALKNGLMSLR